MRDIPKISGIYAIRHKGSGKLYVGSSVNMQARLSHHRTALRAGCHANVHMQNAWNKYGEEEFEFYALESVLEKQQLTAVEQQWIDKLDAVKNGFNKRPVAATNLGITLSVETRRKISIANIGRVVSDETRRKISVSNAGKKASEETKMKMRKPKGKRATPMSQEHREKVSAARKGKPLSAEHRMKLSLAHMELPQSAESRAKKSVALRGIKRSEETRKRMSLGQQARFKQGEDHAIICATS